MYVDDEIISNLSDLLTTNETLDLLNKEDDRICISAFIKYLFEYKKRSPDNHRPAVQSIIKEIKAPSIRIDIRTKVFMALLHTGRIQSFVVIENTAYHLRPVVWLPMMSGIADTYNMLKNGILILAPDAVKSCPHDRDCNNRPIYFSRSDLKSFLKIKPPSNAKAMATAKNIVKSYRQNFPNLRMKRDDFVAELTEKCPGLKKERALKIRKEVVPSEWTKGGRPPKKVSDH